MATRYDIVILDSAASTQDEAARRFAPGGRPVLVVTGEQTKGRGRAGRAWEQADRAVAASLVFTPRWQPGWWGLIPLVTGVAVRAAIATVAGVDVRLKWPNDLVTAAGKVAGILAEASNDTVTVGCGINLFWDHPAPGAAALYDDDPGPDVGERLATAWASRLLSVLDGPVEGWPRDEYLAASVTIGAAVRWEGGEGTAVDIAPDGSLAVDTERGRVQLHSGEVHLRR